MLCLGQQGQSTPAGTRNLNIGDLVGRGRGDGGREICLVARCESTVTTQTISISGYIIRSRTKYLLKDQKY